jgi:6,7-dimethyl-8-ribityllumazine synthase
MSQDRPPLTAVDGAGLRVGVVASRFNGEIVDRLLAGALETLDRAGVAAGDRVVVRVPGAWEVPVALAALAAEGGWDALVALGAVVRGETPHFDYVAGEAASGLQLAAIETGVPVSFGVLTTETLEQAEARIDRAADAVRSALEMAGLFQHLRAASR